MSGNVTVWPNFFIAGVPKAGTTALYHQLRQHPQVYLSPIKEPTFFGVQDFLAGPLRDAVLQQHAEAITTVDAYLHGPQREPGPWRIVMEEERYLRLFEHVREESAIGEASPSYFWLPGAAGAIAARLPAARLVFILRDPAERAFSQHLASGYYDRPETFRERFLAARDPASKWSVWYEPGRYGTHLQRFFGLFPREQILVHLYEDYQADPGAVLRQTFAFLRVDPSFVPEMAHRHNEPAIPRFPWMHAVRRRILRGIVIAEHVPHWLRAVLQRLYLRPRAQIQMDPADRRLVINQFREEIRLTERLIERDLSKWLECP